MAKILKISFPNKCNGCELCVLAIQRQFNRTGLDGSLIRIFRKKEEDGITYAIEMDPSINNYDVASIVKSCPTGVFEITEELNEEQLLN